MSQHSEERASDQVVPFHKKARVLPFEQPQSELQRAVQQRAQEAIDRDRDRAHRKPAPLRLAIVLVLAAIPVFLTFGAAVGFMGALRKFNASIFDAAPPAESEQMLPIVSQEPDVVMLQPYGSEPASTPNPSPDDDKDAQEVSPAQR